MRKVLLAGAIALAVAGTACADIAVSITGGGGGTPAANSVHGWTFTVNENITLTHLGLWDQDNDGFVHRHPIGIYREADGALLASGIMSQGTGDQLIDGFRYIDVADVALVPGRVYVLAYYSDTSGGDFVVTNGENEVFAPEINFGEGRFATNTGGLVMPTSSTGDRYGPNFMFVIPAPGAIALLGVAGVLTRRRRRSA